MNSGLSGSKTRTVCSTISGFDSMLHVNATRFSVLPKRWILAMDEDNHSPALFRKSLQKWDKYPKAIHAVEAVYLQVFDSNYMRLFYVTF